MFACFASRRAFKRLAADLKFWRERAVALEKELKLANAERFERELRLVDRVLTSKERFAVTDEARHSLKERAANDLPDGEKLYLQKRYGEIMADALEAGKTADFADAYYKANENAYREQYAQLSSE